VLGALAVARKPGSAAAAVGATLTCHPAVEYGLLAMMDAVSHSPMYIQSHVYRALLVLLLDVVTLSRDI
jgi:hypothetical protein